MLSYGPSKIRSSLLLAAVLSCSRSIPFGITQGRFPIEVQLRDLQVRAEAKVLTGKNQECAPLPQDSV